MERCVMRQGAESLRSWSYTSLSPLRSTVLPRSAPKSFPEDAEFGTDGFQVRLSPLVDGWYAETWDLRHEWLRDGLRLESGDFVLAMPAMEVTPLIRDRDFGCWSSVGRVEPSEVHMLLVRTPLASAVEAFLAEHALAGHNREPGALAPAGWTLFTNVVIEKAIPNAPEGALAVLAPAVRERPTLRGGLVLDSALKIYLCGGEPDLWLPSLLTDDLAIEIDRTPS